MKLASTLRLWLVASYLLVSGFTPLRGEEKEAEPVPGSPVTILDKFFEDSRDNYRLVGKVEWEAGALKLPPASAVARIEGLLPEYHCELHLWPKASSEIGALVTRFSLPSSSEHEPVIVIFRQAQNGQLFRQVVIGEITRLGEGKEATTEVAELRRLQPFAAPGEIERWAIDYDNGQVTLSFNGQQLGRAYCSSFTSWCHGVVVQQESGSVEISKLVINGKRPGYTPEQRTLYEETKKLRSQSEAALARGETAEAIRLESSRIPLMEQAFGKDDYSLGLAYQWIADIYSRIGRFAEADDAYQSSIDAFGRSLGESHPETLQTEVIKAYDTIKDGYNAEAESTIRAAFKKLLEVAGPGSRSTLTAANRLESLLVGKSLKVLKERDYGTYRDCLKERYELMSVYHAKDVWNLIQAKRDWTEAEELATADEAWQKQYADWMDQYAKAWEFEKQGQSQSSLKLTKALLKTSEKLFGEAHPNTIQAMSAVSKSAGNSGELATAVNLSEKVLAYWREYDEANGPDLVGALINMAACYSMADRHNEAEKLFREAAVACYNAKQLESEAYAMCMLERGRNQIRLGNNKEARVALAHAIKVYNDIGDPANANALKARERLADVCRAEGDLAGAERYLAEQRYLVQYTFGRTSSSYIDVVMSEATHALMMHEFRASVAKYEEALALAKEGYGERSRLYESVLEGLIRARAWAGDPQAAREFLKLVDMRRNQRESLFSIYPERLQFDRVVLDRGLLSVVLQLAVAKEISARDAYNRVLSAKGAVTTYQRALRLASRKPEAQQLVAQLKDISSQIANAVVQPPSETQQAELQSLVAKKEELDVGLSQQSGISDALRDVSVDDVRDVLGEDTALIDYVEYDRQPSFWESLTGKTTVPALLAFVIRKGDEIRLVELGDVQPIDVAATDWLVALELELKAIDADAVAKAMVVDERGATLRKLVWDPLADHVKGSHTVIISPDGFLVSCPFAAFPLEGNQFLVEQKAIAYTPAARMLPALFDQSPQTKSDSPALLVVDEVDYGAPSIAGDETTEAGYVPFVSLPADPDGMESLGKSFQQRHPEGLIERLTGAEAHEADFKKRVESAHFVHLVTHGFCLRASELQMPTDFGTGELANPDASSDPLVAGIAFSGANRGLGMLDGEDSILWADEISVLDLHQAELVVLFACQSALGDYAAGEGMLGCQRALSVAGAQSSLGTLWSVEVGATRELMRQFYGNYWRNSMTKAEALREAMVHMLWAYPEPRQSSRGGAALRCPPALWAGFVLAGDWR